MFSDSEILEDFKGHSVLVVSFAGIKQGIGIPIFEFNNFLNQFKVDKLFIRDRRQLWYQGGIKEAPSINLLKNKLSAIIKKGNYKKVVFIGNSMGGFAAILYGLLVNADSIIAFSPQSFIGFLARKKYKDDRWKNQIIKSQTLLRRNKVMDLKLLLESSKYVNVKIHYSKMDDLDRIHAERLEQIKGVILYPYNFSNHNIIKDLKLNGDLEKILIDSFKV